MSPRRIGWLSAAAAVLLVAVVDVALGGFASPANTIVIGGLLGFTAGIAAHQIAAAARGRDGAERLLAFATAGLPRWRAEWGSAMLAELAAIDDADERRRFARTASVAAFGQGLGLQISLALATAAVAAAAAVTASRIQLQEGQPGIFDVTVFAPALILFVVGAVTACATRSFRIGLQTGALALVASFAAVFTVVALEGLVWMDRHGVFVLDADAPSRVVGDAEVILDFFTTGLWMLHLLFWIPGLVAGAALGARIRGDPASRGASVNA
jgi:hypothetical protein